MKLHTGVVPPDAPANAKPASRQLGLEGEVGDASAPRLSPYPPLTLSPAEILSRFTEEEKDFYYERAAILEHEGKMSLADADEMALKMTLDYSAGKL